MYISNIFQPDSGKETLQPTDAHLSPYRITPCAKAIGALLLVLGSTAAWADDDRRKHSIQQGAEYSTDLNVAQAQDMFQHLNYLAKKHGRSGPENVGTAYEARRAAYTN